jgi:hypothetical protein
VTGPLSDGMIAGRDLGPPVFFGGDDPRAAHQDVDLSPRSVSGNRDYQTLILTPTFAPGWERRRRFGLINSSRRDDDVGHVVTTQLHAVGCGDAAGKQTPQGLS